MNASFDCEVSLSKKLRNLVTGRATITLSVTVEDGRGRGSLFIRQAYPRTYYAIDL